MTFLDLIIFSILAALAEIMPLDGLAHMTMLGLPVMAGSLFQPVWIGVQAALALAIGLYCWRNLADMGWGLFRLIKGKVEPGARLAAKVGIASLPVLALTLSGWGIDPRSVWPAGPGQCALILILFGLVLALADRVGVTVRRIEHMSWGVALGLGLAQGLVLVPGLSRVAAMVVLARVLGYERQEAFRFSLLTGMVWMLVQSLAGLVHLSGQKQLIFSSDLLLAALIAFGLGLVAMGLTMKWLERRSFLPFALWRILFGLGVFGVLLTF